MSKHIKLALLKLNLMSDYNKNKLITILFICSVKLD